MDLGGDEGFAVNEAKGSEPVFTDDGGQFEQFGVQVLGGFDERVKCPKSRCQTET